MSDEQIREAAEPPVSTSQERIDGLRNLRKSYDLVAAVGFWRSLHGEDLIEVYAEAVEIIRQAAWYVKAALDCSGYDVSEDDELQEFIEQHGNMAAYLLSADLTLQSALRALTQATLSLPASDSDVASRTANGEERQ